MPESQKKELFSAGITYMVSGEYVIVSRKIVTLRIVRLSDGDDKLRLVAGDKENYDDIILNVSDIKSVYKVKGKLIINS